jgi:glutamine amidotransferase
MKKKITVIDYGFGNLLSVASAFEYCGADVRITNQFDQIAEADFLVLPGVGAFRDAIRELKRLGLDKAIRVFIRSQRPFLGICLGMQMMMETSQEFGHHVGLGIIEGDVVAINHHDTHCRPHKIPHIGWAPIESVNGGGRWQDSILKGTPVGTHFYFVHSFTAEPRHTAHRLAQTYYGGRPISAAIQNQNAFGCQFHPEKSGPEGINILKRFISL